MIFDRKFDIKSSGAALFVMHKQEIDNVAPKAGHSKWRRIKGTLEEV